jgi:integrase
VHQFFRWLRRAKVIESVPDFPEIRFELAWRRTLDKETQQAVIEEVRRTSHHINLKIWIGIKFLATYFDLRPGELLNIKEGDIDLRQAEILISHPKEKRPKKVFLLPEDMELPRSLSRGLPDLYFFRHGKRPQGSEGWGSVWR